ncbi:MAG: hypothetical protein AAFY28_00250 [Actinomycetota bacterium]
MVVAVRVRSLVWFVTGALLALVGAWAVMSALSVDAAPGDSDSTFEPIENCRLFDFRPGNEPAGPRKTPLGPRETYVQQVTGQVGNCSIPASAVAVAMNVTIDNPTGQSNLRVFPANVNDVPVVSNLNWLPGQSPTPNKVDVKLSPDGAIKLYNQNGTVDVLADVVGFYTSESLTEIDQRLVALESEVTALRATNDTLETKLASVSVGTIGGQPTVTFDGVNVRIVDGSGDTECSTTGFEPCNGRGNLIVGYNEDTADPETRSGSHNLVNGADNEYTNHSGVVFGNFNEVSAVYATVIGGYQNTASGSYSSVTGGFLNDAQGIRSHISGGNSNLASGLSSSVSGGSVNSAQGTYSAVSGGSGNRATGEGSSVSGGLGNWASGEDSSVSGGEGNFAVGESSSVSGGSENRPTGDTASILGGYRNGAGGTYAHVSVAGGNSVFCDSVFADVC